MKQIVFISGKGGTGKSTIVASLSLLADSKIIADCDVDAPNLHLIIPGERQKAECYYGAKQALIDLKLCISCSLCRNVCRFDAITKDMQIIPVNCEGCGACTLGCPQNAISLVDVRTGEAYVDNTQRGTFSHALLDIGEEGSGKLVTKVKENLLEFYKDESWALIDGSPGIGCTVISSITGADAAVAVCEPTKSGKSDLIRVLNLARHFGIPAYICINKYDLNPSITYEIENECEKSGFPVIGKIKFEPAIVNALQSLKTPLEAGLTEVACQIRDFWEELIKCLSKTE